MAHATAALQSTGIKVAKGTPTEKKDTELLETT